jgi:hypothetical protein
METKGFKQKAPRGAPKITPRTKLLSLLIYFRHKSGTSFALLLNAHGKTF